MHAGALRALEFDRIVSVVTGLAVTPTGQDRLAELHPLTDARGGRRGAARHDRGHAVPRRPSGISAARAVGSRGDPRSAWRRGPRARAAAAAGAGRLSRVDRAVAAGGRARSAPPFPILRRAGRNRGVVQAARSPTSAGRSSRRARWPTTPARRSPRSASGCASRSSACDRRSTRSCAGATRRSICRSRSSPTATAATC